jgi:hypothetical protein
MLCLIAEIISLVFGIIAVATGKLTMSKTKIVRGAPARVAGIFLILPLPLALVAGVVIAARFVAEGKVFDRANLPGWVLAVEPAIFGVCFAIAMIIAIANAGPLQPKPPRYEEDDYPEDRWDRGPSPGAEDLPPPPPRRP